MSLQLVRRLAGQALAACWWLPSLVAQSVPQLRIEVPPSVVSGTRIAASARVRLFDSNVLGWSLSVFHEGLEVLETTSRGTDAERLSLGGYAESGIHPDGTAYYSIGALSFTDPITLPTGTSEVLRITCLVSRKEPGEARILPRDGLKLPEDSREFRNEVVVEGGALESLETQSKSVAVTGCADFVLGVAGTAPGERPPAIEVRRDTPIEVQALVRVRSPSHLNPTGFTLAVTHDEDVLSLDAAALVADFVNGFVVNGGFARVDTSASGFTATALSPPFFPRTLGPGDHLVATARYRFTAPASGQATIQTAVRLSDELSFDGLEVTNLFQPNRSRPCAASELPLELVVGPNDWIRGDANVDGRVDVSDAVNILRHLFLGMRAHCKRAMDIFADGRVDISDSVSILKHLFQSGRPPVHPFPACGAAEETLPCERFFCPVP